MSHGRNSCFPGNAAGFVEFDEFEWVESRLLQDDALCSENCLGRLWCHSDEKNAENGNGPAVTQLSESVSSSLSRYNEEEQNYPMF